MSAQEEGVRSDAEKEAAPSDEFPVGDSPDHEPPDGPSMSAARQFPITDPQHWLDLCA